ncbi:MAG: type II secretion system minor pseudopilin GspK [Polymorphobacter sp.]
MRVRASERGAALLTVLILVGVMGAIAVTMFDRLRLATMLAGNATGLEAARAFGMVGEALVTTRIEDLIAASPQKTTLAGGWQGRAITLPLPEGTAVARVNDGGNCFNLNSLVIGTPPNALVSRPIAIEQFIALMALLAVPKTEARRVAASAADWIDSDDQPNADGAEDGVYARAPRAYRAANTMMAEVSELRAVNGVTPALYARLRPWLCALPVAELSGINVNTLAPEQAPLIAMLFGEALRPDAARRVIAERPAAGWNGVAEFWNTPTLRDFTPAGDVLQQPQVRTRWFGLDLRIDVAGTPLHETGLIDARRSPARLAVRRWGDDQ